MKNFAGRFLCPALFAVLTVSVALLPAGCAHEPPIVNDVVTCGGQTVQPTDVQEAYTDLVTENWTDLVTEGVRLGWTTISCVIDQLSATHSDLKPKAESFKAAHAKEIQDARRPSAAMNHAPAGAAFSYAGESVGAAMARCERSCAPADGMASPGTSCLCWRADRKNWRNSRWVSLADSPPGGGPGAVGGGGARREAIR